MQLGTIERCVKLYSNPDEIILTPFGGIGSEGYEAVRLGRKSILIELKKSYYRILLQNMKQIESKVVQPNLFTLINENAEQKI